MKKTLSIRLEESDRLEIDRLATAYDLAAADLIRMAIKAMLREAGRNGGKITLPVELSDFSTHPQPKAIEESENNPRKTA